MSREQRRTFDVLQNMRRAAEGDNSQQQLLRARELLRCISEYQAARRSDNPDRTLETRREDRSEVHFTSKGRQVPIFHQENSVKILPSMAEEQWLEKKGVINKVKRIEPATNKTNSYGYVFANGKGMVDRAYVNIIIEDNFEAVENPQVGDRLIYRYSSTKELLYAAKVTEILDGKVSNVSGKILPGGSIYKHHPDLIKEQIFCDWELLRPKEEVSLKHWRELFIPGKDYVTSQGRSIEVFHPVKDMPVIPPELEKWELGAIADKIIRIEGPNPAYNCFGHGILDKKGMIHNVDDIIKDDFTLVETPQVGDRLVGRDPATRQSQHMAVILKAFDGKVSDVISKEGQLGLYIYNFNTLKGRYKGLSWEICRKNSSVQVYKK